MALIIPPGFGQAVFSFNWGGDAEPMVTTLGLDLTGYVGEPDVNVADSLFANWATTILQQQTTNLFLTEVVVYVGQDGPGTEVVESTAAAVQGAANSPALPPNCAGLLRKRTGLAGRRGRGRMYVPGMAESEVDANGYLGGTYKGALQAEASEFVLNLLAAGLLPVVLHRTEGIGTEPSPTPITALVWDDRIATQRRRLRS